MKPSEQPPSPEVIKEVFAGMVRRMRNYAVMASEQVSPRSYVGLQALGLADDLFEEKPPAIGHDIPVDIIRNPDHPLRSPIPPGPLFLYRTDEKATRTFIELPILLLSENKDIRDAAFGEVKRLLQHGSLDMTPKSSAIIDANRSQRLSEDETEWRKAVLAVYDALNEDFLLALQGALQSMSFEPAIQESLNSYLPRVLYPVVSSLDSLSVAVVNPSSEHERLAAVIKSIVDDASSLQEACQLYMSKLGYLPLAASFSLGELVTQWFASHPDCNAWDEVWSWAEQAFGPLPVYHACAVFVLYPDWIPEGKHAELWRQILFVLNLGKSGASKSADARWVIRRQLAQHYAMLLEAQLIGHNTEPTTCVAWKLSEMVISLFPDNPNSARFYQENWLDTGSNISSSVWLSSIARTEHTFFRCMTLNVNAPWAVSLLSLMGNAFSSLHFTALDEDIREQIRNAIHTSLLMSFPYAGTHDKHAATYAVESGFGKAVADWLEVSGEPESEAFRQLLDLQQSLLTPDGISAALETLDTRQEADQIAVGLALKADAYKDGVLADKVWEFLAKSEWRSQAFESMNTTILALFVEALLSYQVQFQEKWFYELPHCFAALCEKQVDKERQEILFIATVQFSMASDSVSAIQRLLRGEKKEIFAPMAESYAGRLKSMWSYHPAWSQGRLRASLSALNV